MKIKPIKWRYDNWVYFNQTIFDLFRTYILPLEGERCSFNNQVFDTLKEAKKHAQKVLNKRLKQIIKEFLDE